MSAPLAEPRAPRPAAPAPDGPVDAARWLADRWLTDRRRPPLAPVPGAVPRAVPHAPPVPRLEYPVTHVGRTGAGVRVALLDAAVDLDHPDLRGARVRDLTGRGAAGSSGPAPSATAHASLLVGQGVRDLRGLVPDADLLVATVLTRDGFTSDELLIRGVRRAVAEGADVLVLPFGRRRLGHRVAMVLRAAAERGVRVVVAAGDLGPDVLAFPASVAGVEAVTAHDDGAVLPGCSRWADVAAPGRDVPAAGPGGVVLLRGSSPAAVLAAGAHVAVLGAVRAHRGEPGEPGEPGASRHREGREAREGHRLVHA